jgi:Secretion system C-terminal sorting domain/SprB repeat
MKRKFLLILLCSLVRIHALLADDVSAQVYNETSAGASDGRIILTMAGGIAPYSFSWSGPNGYTAATQNLSNLRAGNYNVTINDAYCGTATLNIVVTVCNLIATTETTGTCGSDVGSVSIQLQNGSGPYTYSMRSSFSTEPGISDNPIAQNLPAGNYSMRIADAKGCKTNASFQIVASPIVAAHLDLMIPSCTFNPDGGVNINVHSGTPPYRFEWSDGSTAQNLDAVLPGNYSVQIRDQQNCSYFGNFAVGAVPPAVLPSNVPCGLEFRCKGNSDFRPAPTFTRNNSERCTYDQVCTATGEVIWSEQAILVWEPRECCCSRELVCSLSGESFGWLPCGLSLETVPGCCIVYLQCDCTSQRAFYYRYTGSECFNLDCDREFGGGLPPPNDDKNIDYLYYKDPQNNQTYRFTFDEIFNKTYKKQHPELPDVDLNQKTTLNGKSGTIYELLKPKKFFFSVTPNPFESNPTVALFVTPDFNADSDNATMTISNELGQVISKEGLKDLHVGENKIQPDFNNLPSGMYLIAIELKDKKEVKKVYKK